MVTLLAMRIPRTSSTELLSSWLPPASTGAQGYSPPGSGLCISLAQLHNVPAGPLFQPPKVPVHDGPDLELINCSPWPNTTGDLTDEAICLVVRPCSWIKTQQPLRQPLVTTLWLWQSSQFSTHLMSKSWQSRLSPPLTLQMKPLWLGIQNKSAFSFQWSYPCLKESSSSSLLLSRHAKWCKLLIPRETANVIRDITETIHLAL